jgi:pimeloyl-ACP methyl ester carboxylesterase
MSSPLAVVDHFATFTRHHAIELASGLSLNLIERDAPKTHSDAPTVLLLHGLADAAVVWHNVAEALRTQARVLAPDLRGHGNSSWPADADYRIASIAADVAELMDTLQLPPLTLVGHSMGASVALHLACARPDRVERLVLADLGLDADPRNAGQLLQALRDARCPYASVDDYAAVLLGRHPLASPDLLRRVAAQTSERHAHGQFELKYDERVIAARERMAQETRHGAYHPAWDQLAALTCPVLVLRGAASSVLSTRVAQRMTDTLRHGTLRQIPVSGHSIHLDNPSAVTQAIAHFLQPGEA